MVSNTRLLKQRLRLRLWLIPIISIAVTLVTLEIAVRSMTTADEDGNVFVKWRQLKPYHVPISVATERLDDYVQHPHPYIVYDEALGWTNAPNSADESGLYEANNAGLRAEVDYPLSPRPGRVRIALFGDSYTHANDVVYEESWGSLLETMLRERGVDVEVLNFGVAGYGMGQAYLRWQTQGRAFAPDLVIFGFQAENVNRNVNVLRIFYHPEWGNVLTKPRFSLEDGELTLVNSPTIPPEEIPDLLENLDDSPLLAYEGQYDPEDYTLKWWQNSQLPALAQYAYEAKVVGTAGQYLDDPYDLDDEPVQVTQAIIQAFEEDVEAHGAQFVIVHLPVLENLQDVRAGRPLPYDDLLAHLDENYDVIHTLDGMAAVPPASLFGEEAHYSPAGNQAVATVLADNLAGNLPDVTQRP